MESASVLLTYIAILGFILGFVVNKTNFCTMGAVSDWINIGDFSRFKAWMLAAAIGWALYSIYLFYWKTKLPIFQRFVLVAFFGSVSLLPFYILEEFMFQRTTFNIEFFSWVTFAAISPGIIAFTLYSVAQKSLGASLTGFTLYIFTIYAAIYGYILFDEQLEIYHLFGTILVFMGVYLAKKKYEIKT